MGCLGVHFAITDADLHALREASSDDEVVEMVQEMEEQRWNDEDGFLFQTDKAWDAIHRCLTDGEIDFDNGTEPLKLCILGGEPLHSGDGYIVTLVAHDKLRALANALGSVTPAFMTERYWKLPEDYLEKSDDDLEYTLENFAGLPAFFDRAEKAGRHVIFTASQ